MVLSGIDTIIQVSTVEDDADDAWETLYNMSSISMSHSGGSIDVGSFGTGDFSLRVLGMRDVTYSISGFFAVTDTSHQMVMNSWLNDTDLWIKAIFNDGGAAEDGFKQKVKVASIDVSAAVDGIIEFSLDLEGDGQPTTTTKETTTNTRVAPTRGIAALVKISQVSTTGTAFGGAGSEEAMTDVGAALTVYQITNTVKRLLNPLATTPIAFQKSTDAFSADIDDVAASEYTINYLTGTITFLVAQAASTTVRVKASTGEYLTLANVGQAKSFTLTMQANNLDSTVFGSSDFMGRVQGQRDTSGNIGRYIDTAAPTQFHDAIQAGRAFVFDFYSDATDAADQDGWDFRVRGLITGRSNDVNFDSLSEEALDFEGTSDDQGNAIAFGF